MKIVRSQSLNPDIGKLVGGKRYQVSGKKHFYKYNKLNVQKVIPYYPELHNVSIEFDTPALFNTGHSGPFFLISRVKP